MSDIKDATDPIEKLVSATEETNRLLTELLETQKAVRQKQKRFWQLGIFYFVFFALFIVWFFNKYGF